MTATDTLRAMLDERGVRYTKAAAAEGVLLVVEISGEQYFILVRDNGAGIEMWSRYFTPEQAIAATLGAETCFPALSSERDGMPYLDPWFVCSECGCQLTESRLGRIWQNYCPNCGRRIRIRRVDGE